MKLNSKCIALALALTLAAVRGAAPMAQPAFRAGAWPALDRQVEEVMGRLTLDEKLSLMVHQNPAIPHVGLRAYSWWNEALHGVGRAGEATVYPMPVALAATFDTALVRRLFAGVAAEARRKHREACDTGYFGDYAGLTFFTPNINIFRDPRWGRGMETYGEDPYLTAAMGRACVEGLQGGGVAACLKHLAVHSGPEGVRHEFDSRVDLRDLRTTYLPAFEYIVQRTDVAQVMCGYNRLNGEPCCTHRELLVDVLRGEWGYDGLIVTDCWALNDAYERDTVIPRHRTHASAALAYGDAFGSEVDLECGSGLPALRDAVRYGYVPERKIDEHVRRLLRTRLAVEQWDSVFGPAPAQGKGCWVDPADAAARSMVLLKNNGVLPLREHENLRLAGPNAADSLMPLGNYNGTPRHTVTLREALGRYEALSAGDGRTVVYCGGLNPQLEGEELPVETEGFYRGDRTRIELPSSQVSEIKTLKAAGNRVVLVLCTGSALALDEVIDDVDAVLVAWYGGQAMGTAVKQLLFGERDDFGRLPVTFYRATGQLPPFDDYAMQHRTYRYLDAQASPARQPLFPFGFGLGYARFGLRQAEAVQVAGGLRVTAVVALDSVLAVTESHRTVLQCYVEWPDDGQAPMRSLVHAQPVELHAAGQSAEVQFTVDPFWLRVYNERTGRMEPPASGSRGVLKIGFGSNDEGMVALPVTFRENAEN